MNASRTKLLKVKTGKRRSRLKTVIILTFCIGVIYLSGSIPVVAEYVFARGITRFLDYILNGYTNWIPVSFYEISAALLIAGGIVYIAALVSLLLKKRFSRAGLYLYRLCIVLLSVLLAFCTLYSPLYNRKSVNETLGLDVQAASEEEIYAAAEYFIAALNETGAQLSRDADGNVIPTHTFDEIAEMLNDEYDRYQDGFFASFDVRPKQVQLSVAMSYLGISGIYIPFYAESNVNTNIPSYTLPSVMAHEMAHAKGVSLENEANVTAYVLCAGSEDAYIRYSGLMSIAARLINSLSGETRSALREQLDAEILTEYANASAHYAEYEGWIDSVSSFFNDVFLKANGVSDGTSSYSETTLSFVAFYKKQKMSENGQ